MRTDSPTRQTNVWPYWLGASAIAICSAEAAFGAAAGPERYAQFTVGSITWRGASKHGDYALVVGLLAGFAWAWLAILLTERRVERRLASEGVEDLRALLAYASLPFVIWASGLVLGTSSTRDLVWLSAIGVSLAVALMWMAADRVRSENDATPPGRAAALVLLATALGALSPLIAVCAVNRLAIPSAHALQWTGTPSAMALAASGGVVGLLLGLWAWRGDAADLNRRFGIALVCVQLLLPWGFLVVMPAPWASGSFIRYGGPVGTIPWMVFALVAIAYVDVARRSPLWQREPSSRVPLQALSPLGFAAALLFVKLSPISIRQLLPDDYHFGEYLLPWWSLTAHGAVPFWDYVPARGLINYLDGAVAALSFGSAAAGVAAAAGLVAALVLIVSLVALASWIGLLPAVAALLVLPLDAQLTQVDALNTSALILLFAARTRLSATVWLMLWLVVGTAAFLLAPAQGTILVLATVPLGLWQLVSSIRFERPRLLRLAGFTAGASLILLVATPLGRMIGGALRYAREHSAVSGPAHGFEWTLSAASSTVALNRWLFEGVRASWTIVGMCAIALLVSSLLRKDSERRHGLVLVALPTIVMAAFFIYRAAGRIDPGWVSRLGYVSVWMIAVMLPLLLYAAWGSSRLPLILTVTVAGSGLFAPQLGGILTLQAVGHRALESEPHPTGLIRGFDKAQTNIGRVGMFKADRYADISQELGVLLDPDETYLDLTNRNAEYFYLGREVPIESGAIYNLPNDRQQLRAIDRLRARRVPVVLALADSQVYDGAPPSYRVYTIYRYLISRYVPVLIRSKVYLVMPDRLPRLAAHPELTASLQDPAELLDRVFRLADVQRLPASWGASWASLAEAASLVRRLGEPTAIRQARSTDAGQYIVDGATAELSWDLSAAPLAGKDAGILTFDFTCEEGSVKDLALEARWSAPGAVPDATTSVRFQAASRVAIPLDAAPRWLMAPAIGSMEIRLADPGGCRRFSVRNLAFWQRRVAAAADAN